MQFAVTTDRKSFQSFYHSNWIDTNKDLIKHYLWKKTNQSINELVSFASDM